MVRLRSPRVQRTHWVPGTAEQRSPFSPAPALLPTCPPPGPAAETHSPQELNLVLAAVSPFGHDFRGVGAAPASGASAFPRSRSACAGYCRAPSPLPFSSSSSGFQLSLSSTELIPNHIGSWANTPLHCRAPTKQPAYPSHLSPKPSARRPRAQRRAGARSRLGCAGNLGRGGWTFPHRTAPHRAAPRRAAHSAEALTPRRPEGASYPARIHKQRPVA